MTLKLTSCSTVAALLIAVGAAQCHAAMITNWRTYKASPATTLAGQGTDDPIVGSVSPSITASQAFVIGHLSTPAVLGPNTGDTVTLHFGVRFNDAVGMAQAGDNFRFALFNLNGEVADSATGGVSSGPNYATAGTDNTDNFRGYWLGVKSGTGMGSGGSIRERSAMLAGTENNAFANAGSVSLGSVGGDPITWKSDVNGNGAGVNYGGRLTLTRTSTGLVDVSGSFRGGNAPTGNVFSASDTTANGSSTYGAVGFLIAGGISADQAIFKNVTVSIPEPTCVFMLGIAIASACVFSRKRLQRG
jgi:hypothetical protein